MLVPNGFVSRRGFTLVEIMIVVAIIALLAAIAIPNYASARRRACESGCKNNLKKIEAAMHEWAFEARASASSPVTFENIRPNLQRSVVCPSGGKTFSDSYALSTVDAAPVCLLVPDTHRIDDELVTAEKEGKGWAWGEGGRPR